MSPESRKKYFELISGHRRGWIASVHRALLSAASVVYRTGLGLRSAYYLSIPGAVHRADRPVISIGNLTTGGTGKTPLAAWLANHLADQGIAVGLLTRGYSGKRVQYSDDERAEAASRWRVESDEAMLLTRLCPRAAVVIDPDRLAGAKRAAQGGAKLLLLDDGFAHRRLARDLDIVLIDATCPFGYGHLLPRGLLRESPRALRRADLVIVTRSDLIDETEIARLTDLLRDLSGGRPIIRCRHRLAGFVDVKGRPMPDVDPNAMQAVLFAGIARFGPFRRSVEQIGTRVLAAYEYPDHHDYTDDEISILTERAVQLEANALITTEKDAVKLVGRWPESPIPLLAARLVIEFAEPGVKILTEAVNRVISVAKPSTTESNA